MNRYRTHYCGKIDESLISSQVKVSGWVETIRDHGGVIFIDLRDHVGIVQIVFNDDSCLRSITRESVVCVSGKVAARDEININEKIPTGKVEIRAEEFEVLGKSLNALPFEISSSHSTKEDLRLKYRFLDLRNEKLHNNIVFRSEILHYLRNKMHDLGFVEIQTPILSASSPEGARDYLVPSRKHKGKFYALPQAPQIFKQLLMVSGFDKYFQIAPCFRDEDSRADRAPGEFYQLDFEMAFATQEDVLKIGEEILYGLFSKFSKKEVSKPPFRRITYRDAMEKFGTDKPDLRNPLRLCDLSSIFQESNFVPFKGRKVIGINVPNCSKKPRKFFDEMLKFAESLGMKGLGYIKVDENVNFSGPINKFIPEDCRDQLIKISGVTAGSVLYFVANEESTAQKYAGQIRNELGERLGLIDESRFEFCFVVDYPIYEIDEETGKIVFTHNPFSMPQGGLEALNTKNPLEILAYQYDIVCNGIELSSGAVRNHSPEIMLKAFEIAGYSEKDILEKFGALYNAFKYGAPPHAGMAPGLDRIVMLLTNEKNIREVIAFPLNNNAQDCMLGSPTAVTEKQLREVHIKLRD